MILGVIGPWQMVVLLVIPVGLIIGVIVLVNSRAKHKGRAEAMKECYFKEHYNCRKKGDKISR
jgi:F0F1-type ATP synthase assembly protein I